MALDSVAIYVCGEEQDVGVPVQTLLNVTYKGFVVENGDILTTDSITPPRKRGFAALLRGP